MNWLMKYLSSSIGLKTVMGLTGLGLVGFVLVHLAGNLNLYAGPDALNAYAANLKSLGPFLWVGRAGLLAIFLVHVYCAFRLYTLNNAARPIGYTKREPLVSTLASRTMFYTGLVILAFLLYHLAHYTFLWIGDIGTYTDELGRHDVYRMVTLGFSDPVVVLLYVFANLTLGLHMSHGIKSSFQSLGIRDRKYVCAIESGGAALAWILAFANVSMPLAVFLGLINP